MTGGTGLALLLTGLIIGHHASAIGDEVTNACASSCDWSSQKSKDDAGQRDAALGYALDGVGIAAIAGGTLMYYLGSRESISVAPATHAGGAMVSWSGSW